MHAWLLAGMMLAACSGSDPAPDTGGGDDTGEDTPSLPDLGAIWDAPEGIACAVNDSGLDDTIFLLDAANRLRLDVLIDAGLRAVAAGDEDEVDRSHSIPADGRVLLEISAEGFTSSCSESAFAELVPEEASSLYVATEGTVRTTARADPDASVPFTERIDLELAGLRLLDEETGAELTPPDLVLADIPATIDIPE